MSMGTIVFPTQVHIPARTDLRMFRRWARSEAFPEHGWIAYLDGNLWVDLSTEELVHNLIKSCFCTFLTLLVNQDDRGPYLGDRMLLTNVDADLSTEPDGMFLSGESLRTGKAKLSRGKRSIEVVGSPDMTLEVISPNSVEKDMDLLPRVYFQAGVAEFWLVDSRDESPQLQIWRRGKSKYVAVPLTDGWAKSAVFGKSFRLVFRTAAHGVPVFSLEMK